MSAISLPARAAAKAEPRPLVWLLTPLLCGLAAFAVYVATAAPTLSWRNGGEDGGDLAVAAASLSVAHPTGYPLYVLLGGVWTRILPIADVAYRLNILSGLCTAVAVAGTAWAASELLRAARPKARTWPIALASAGAALLLGFSQPVWGQAVVVSVYSLNLALVAILLALVLRAQRSGPSTRGAALFGALLGLGVGNHVTLVFAGLAAAVVALCERWSWRVWRAAAGPLILGIVLVYSYLLLGQVEARDPIGAWGDPSSLPGLFALVTAQSYQSLVGSVPPGQVAGRLLFSAGQLTQALTPVGLLAALTGVGQLGAINANQPTRRLAAPLILAVCSIVFAVTYGGARGEHHLLPAYLALALLASLGFLDVLAGLPARGPVSAIAMAALVVVALSLGKAAAATGDHAAVDFATSTLQTQPANGRVTSQGDADTFALWYAQEVLGVRRDVAVVQLGLWQQSPTYRAKLMARHPTTSLP